MRSMDSRPSSPGLPERARVWLVDDSPLERELAKRILSEQYEVDIFSDGPPVLERLAAGERPDVLVLDWHMPQMSGLEVCRFLREHHDARPVFQSWFWTATRVAKDDLAGGLGGRGQ